MSFLGGLLGRRTPDIAKLQAERDVAGLIAALRHADARLRREAAHALGSLGDERARQPLSIALDDADHGVRAAAAEAIGKLVNRP